MVSTRFPILLLFLISISFAPVSSEGGPSPQPLKINYLNDSGNFSDLINLICPGNLLEFNISSNDKPVSEVEIRLILYEPYQGFKRSKLTDKDGKAVFNMTNERDGKYQLDTSKNGYVKPDNVFFDFVHCKVEPKIVEPQPTPTPQPVSIPEPAPQPTPEPAPEPLPPPSQPPEALLDLTTPDKTEVGKEFSVKATKDGKACDSCTIVVLDPDGRELSRLITDANGEIKTSMPKKGNYELRLLTDEGVVAKKAIVTVELVVSTEELERKQAGFLDDPSIKNSLGVAVTVIILVLIYLWWRGYSERK